MRRPRIRLRTLMVAVAIAAIECWAFLTFRSHLVGVLLFGPLVGAFGMGLRSPERFFGFLCGGLLGGLAESGLGVIVLTVHHAYEGLTRPGEDFPRWDVHMAILFAGVILGFVVGVTAGLLDLLRLAIACLVRWLVGGALLAAPDRRARP